jgi:hypothetical protein
MENEFRVKGSICTFIAKTDPKTKMNDKVLFLAELKTLKLKIWNGSGYDNIDANASPRNLQDWSDGYKPFQTVSHPATQAMAEKTPSGHRVQMDQLLAQLQGLVHGCDVGLEP